MRRGALEVNERVLKEKRKEGGREGK